MNEQKNILVPIDFNQKSLIALEQATSVAKLLKHDIMLLYVHEESGIFSKLFSDSQGEDKVLETIQLKMDEIASQFNKLSGVRIKNMLAKGRVSSKIVEIAEIINSELIIMGTNSEVEFKKTIGANTHRVVRWAKCPVITINGLHHEKGCRSILLPLDLSIETRQKVTRAIEMAKHFGATIKVVSALWSKSNKEVATRLHAQLNQVHNYITERNIQCHSEIIDSTQNEKTLVPIILKYAKEQGDIDLIMIMTQKEIGFVDYFMDSDAQETIRTSEIPVMCIAPKEIGIIQSKGF
ncbi:MAG: universal stress protein [Bacteroidetes bacterium]|nr:universal stress protein [Bacteroidota bacterium]